MDAPQFDPKTSRTLPVDRQAALRETEQALEAGRFRRQLDLVGEVDRRSVGQRQSALQGQFFAEAATLQLQRSGSQVPVGPRPAATAAPDVLVSIRNGMIGSLYLSFGRVRMTHDHGPELSIRSPDSILRYNIKENQAMAAFRSAVPDSEQQTVLLRARYIRQSGQQISIRSVHSSLHQKWMSQVLRNSETPPDWAQVVTGPESVGRVEDIPPRSDMALFEIYQRGPNLEPRMHLSRGMAARMPITKQTLDAIALAVDLAAKADQPSERNRVFYDYLREHAPDFARMIREP